MDVQPALALPDGLDVRGIEMIDTVLTITAVSTQLCPCCPLCGTPASRVHSRSMRKLTDLPCSGQQVRMQVEVRKCFCEVSACARKIFVERLMPFVDSFGRVTRRLYQMVQSIGLATGGRLGVRVTDRLSIQTSRATIIRRIMALPTEPVGHITQIGIDDFSFRRGRKFGTIVVDLQTHKMLDVLPDRTAETSATWMAAHPELEIVSRDRGGDSAAAAQLAVPQATQCADRFHLMQNLSKSLEGFLSHHLAAHRMQADLESRATTLSPTQGKGPPKKNPKRAEVSQTKREERLAQYQQVIARLRAGVLANSHRCPGRGRSCNRLTLALAWHLS